MIPRNDATTTPNLTSPIKSMLLALAALLGGLLAALALRIYVVLPRIPRRSSPPPPAAPTASLAVFLGSGGHTAEMRALLASVDKARYTPRIYVYGAGDNMSLRAVAEVEGDASSAGYSLLALPRARRVGEGRLSTLLSATKTLLVATWYTFLLPLLQRPSRPWADVLLLNGPGTAVVLVLVMYIRRVSGSLPAETRSWACPTRASSTSSRLRGSSRCHCRASSSGRLWTPLSRSGRVRGQEEGRVVGGWCRCSIECVA